MPKVLIADDHPLYRSALRTVLGITSPDYQVVEVESFQSAVTLLQSDDDFELVLLDLNMPGVKGFSGVIEIRKAFPLLPVVVVSGEDKPTTISQVRKLGAAGFLSKTATPKEIGECLTAIENGEEWFPEGLEELTQHSFPDLLTKLTPQQYRIAQMIAEGLLNKQIAYELSITEPTVKSHVTSILRKLGVRDRKQLIKEATVQW